MKRLCIFLLLLLILILYTKKEQILPRIGSRLHISTDRSLCMVRGGDDCANYNILNPISIYNGT